MQGHGWQQKYGETSGRTAKGWQTDRRLFQPNRTGDWCLCGGLSSRLFVAVGTVQKLPTKASNWAEVERQQIQINKPDFRKRVTFADLAEHYQEHELGERRSAIVDPKAHTTIAGYKRVLRNRLLPRWGKRFALSIQPLEVEEWLSAVKGDHHLENPTLGDL